MIKKTKIIILLVFSSLFIFSCDGQKGAREIWEKVLKKCTQSDLLSKKVLFFGPSLGRGPGSIWRKTNNGGYNLKWKTSSLEMSNDFIIKNETFSCRGEIILNSKKTGSLNLKKLIPVLEANAKVEFQKAQKIKLLMDWGRWDTLEEGPYEAEIIDKKINEKVANDLVKDNRFVITRALYINKLKAELEFDSKTATELGSKYQNGVDVGGGLKANWESDTKLTIESDSGFYIAGELTAISLTGFSSKKTIYGEKVKNLHKSTAGEDIQ